MRTLFTTLGIVFCFAKSDGQTPSFRFENLSVEEGLSQSSATAIVQDQKGFLWIGTDDGLNRYDGYTFKVYRHEINDPASLIENFIESLYYDSVLWIGTNKGLSRYDEFMDQFTNDFKINEVFSGRIGAITTDQKKNVWLGAAAPSHVKAGVYYMDPSGKSVTKIQYEKLNRNVWASCRDSKGILWFGTDGRGVSSIDPVSKRVLKTIDLPGHLKKTCRVTCIIEDSNHNYWFGTDEGLVRYNDQRSDSIMVYQQNARAGSISNNYVEDIHEDKKTKKIWVGTLAGINILDPISNQFVTIKHEPERKESLAENRVIQIIEDRSGNKWIGYYYAGLGKIMHNKGFQVYSEHGLPNRKLLTSNIEDIFQDKSGGIWASSLGGGLNHLTRPKEVYEVSDVIQAKQKVNWLTNTAVTAFTQGKDGIFWLGTWGDGIFSFDSRIKNFVNYRLPVNNEVFSIFEESPTTILAGNNRSGLYRFNKVDKSFKRLIPDERLPQTLKSTSFSNIFSDSHGRIFATSFTYGMIYLFNRNLDRFFPIGIDKNGIYYDDRSNIVSAMITDSILWIGTNQGLAKYELHHVKDSTYLKLKNVYRQKDGLPSEVINGILEDHKQNLWLGHTRGLTKFNPKSLELTNFDVSDGLPGYEFNSASASRFSNNELAFGSTKGLVIFHPDSLKSNEHAPTVEFTDIKISTKSVVIKGTGDTDPDRFTIDQAVGFTKELILPYDFKILSFEFAALEYTVPKKNRYQYKLEGFDKDWVSTETRMATYTNLSPGNYTFLIKASNNDGVWSEQPATMAVTILPPPWKTWWAYSLYISIGIVLLIFARQQVIRRERLKNEVNLKKMEAEKYREIDTLKSRFFANISHEFRTPLTLILGPLEKYLKAPGNSPGRQTELTSMHQNAVRLLNLVNQLLDLSRFEAGSMKLAVSVGELVQFVTTIMSEFQSLADSKQIRFSLVHSEPTVQLYYDRDKLGKILNNLLANAFKFTPEGGEVTISIHRGNNHNEFENGYAIISVKDSGIGIASEQLPKIFDRFYQVDNTLTRAYEGSGIGLALTKELVQLCHGTIAVESEVGKGSTFTICLPLGNSAFREEEVITPVAEPALDWKRGNFDKDELEIEKEAMGDESSHFDTSVLIIEDNTDLRAYLKNELSTSYHVIEAVDGNQGVEIAIREIPTIIISDLMMPGKDGMKVCELLKEDERTSHIPIILLTAKAEMESKLQGYRIGADEYMAKPFQMAELQLRIENLITNRKRLREKYSMAIELKPSELKSESMEDRFLKKVMTVVESHIMDPSFGLEQFASAVGMSKIQLYRKLKALTQHTPNEFIRDIRLQRANQLLRNRTGNVAEVAYQVGFKNLSYFSKTFKEKFGKTPSELL